MGPRWKAARTLGPRRAAGGCLHEAVAFPHRHRGLHLTPAYRGAGDTAGRLRRQAPSRGTPSLRMTVTPPSDDASTGAWSRWAYSLVQDCSRISPSAKGDRYIAVRRPEGGLVAIRGITVRSDVC
jgi:hypothetical protein